MLLMPIRSETSAPPRTASKFTAAIGALIRIADPLILVGGALLAYRIRFGTWHLQKDYVSLVVITTLFGLLIFGSSSLYRSWRGRGLGAELMHLGLCWLLICTGVLFYTTLIQMIGELSRLWLGAWFGLSLAGAASIRIVLRGCASWARARGMDLRTAVIVGGNPDAQRIVDTLHRNPWMGIKVVGWFATSADRCALHGIRPMGRVDRLAAFVEARHIDQVWIALPMREQDQIAYVLRQLDFSTADIKLLPDLFGLQLLNHSVEQIGGLPVLNLRSSPLDGPAHLIKATMDKVLASLILLMISPLMIAIAIGVLVLLALAALLLRQLLRIPALARWIARWLAAWRDRTRSADAGGYVDEVERLTGESLAAGVIRRLKSIGRRESWAAMTPEERIRWLFRRRFQRAEKRGFRYRRQWTPRENISALQEIDRREADARLDQVYEEVRYGGRPAGKDEAEALKERLEL